MKKLFTILCSVLVVVIAGFWVCAKTPQIFYGKTTVPFSPSDVPALNPSVPTAGPSISIAASPVFIAADRSTLVTVMSVIPDPSLIPNSVNLFRLGDNGQVISVLGQLRDDGQGGDATAGDHTFTIRLIFAESSVGQIRMQASAAFRGILKRTSSSVLALTVGKLFTNSDVSFIYPTFGTATRVTATRSSDNEPLINVEVLNPTAGEFLTAYGLIVYANTSHNSLQQWFEQNIDTDHILTNHGVFAQQVLDNGLVALVRQKPIPKEYLVNNGPVEEAFLISASGDKVIGIVQSHDGNLQEYGYSQEAIHSLLIQTLASVSLF